jgi:hypothetical protein
MPITKAVTDVCIKQGWINVTLEWPGAWRGWTWWHGGWERFWGLHKETVLKAGLDAGMIWVDLNVI